jgi:Pvc16 N-terminal domain
LLHPPGATRVGRAPPGGDGRHAIAAASDTLVRHLRARLEEADALDGWTVEATTLPEARANPGHGVTFVLWRVQPDEPAGDTSPLRTASKRDPPEGVGLKPRCLLVVRGNDGGAEQTMLGRCMAVLDRHPVAEETGAPGSIAADALVVAVEVPPDDAYLRLVEACGDPSPLVVPYVARSVHLRPPAAGRIPDQPAGTAEMP